MSKNFILTESEKKEILAMHTSNGYKTLSEQKSNTPSQDAFTKFLEAIVNVGQPNMGTGWIIDPSLPEAKSAVVMNTNKLLGSNWTVKPYTNVKDGQPLIWSLYPFNSQTKSKEKDVYCVIKMIGGIPYIEFNTSYFNLPEMSGRSYRLVDDLDKVISYLSLIYNQVNDTLASNNKTTQKPTNLGGVAKGAVAGAEALKQ